MLVSKHLSKPCKMSIHVIFPCHLCTLWEMVDLLVSCQRLVQLWLYVRASPTNRPLLTPLRHLSETVILKSVPNQGDIDSIVELEEVAFVRGLVGTDGHRIYVGSEYQVLLLRDIDDGLLCCSCVFKSKIKLSRLVSNHHLIDLMLQCIFSTLYFLLLVLDLLYCLLATGALNLLVSGLVLDTYIVHLLLSLDILSRWLVADGTRRTRDTTTVVPCWSLLVLFQSIVPLNEFLLALLHHLKLLHHTLDVQLTFWYVFVIIFVKDCLRLLLIDVGTCTNMLRLSWLFLFSWRLWLDLYLFLFFFLWPIWIQKTNDIIKLFHI